MDPNTVDIIVIGYDLPKLERSCLQSILFQTKHPYLLTYYDNFNKDTTLTQIWNQLIGKSLCNYICLLNNDTIVTKDWLTKLMQTLQSDPSFGFVGPSTNSCHSPQKKIASLAEAKNHENEIEIMPDPISGFCLLFNKKIWDELNGFDERYNFYGQESDFCSRAHQLGYKSVWRKDTFIFHFGEQSVKKSNMDVKKERLKARKIYWGDRGRKL